MKEKLYEEIGANYRFFLAWRHAAFAGNLIVLWGTASLCISAYNNASLLLWAVPMLASPIGVLLWMIDVRTRDLYHATIDAGKELEGETKGFYSKISEKVALTQQSSPFSKVTQSAALNLFFLGSSLFLFLSSIYLLLCPIVK